MARRHGHTEEQILTALRQTGGGATMIDVYPQVRISGQTFYVWKRKYAGLDTELETLEKAARDAKNGLWVNPAPIPPWVYRKARYGQALDLSDLVPLDDAPDGHTSSRAPPLLEAVEPDAPLSTSPYLIIIGDRRSHLYHRPDCPNYTRLRLGIGLSLNAERGGSGRVSEGRKLSLTRGSGELENFPHHVEIQLKLLPICFSYHFLDPFSQRLLTLL